MICSQSEGAVDRRTIFVCDICNQPITDITHGAAVFRDIDHGGGELHTVLHAHKDRCLDKAEERMVGRSGGGPWRELGDHLNDVIAGMGVTIRSMIDREVGGTGALNPNQHDELRQRITKLEAWLREHGAVSPLWD